jgi:hypothetical protein
MTTNRILTTFVQLALAGGAIILGRMMWQDLKQDIKETVNDLRKQK